MSNIVEIPYEQYKKTELSDEDARSLLKFFSVMNFENDPDYVPSPLEQRLKGLREPNPYITNFSWFVRKDDEIIANAELGYMNENHPAFEENKHLLFLDLDVHRDYRKLGIAKTLLRVMKDTIKDINRPKVGIQTSHDTGKEVAIKYGGKIALEGADNRLYLDDVDWDLMISWVDEGQERAPGVTMQEFSELPEDIAEEYLNVYIETMNQQPLGDTDLEMKEDLASRRFQEKRMADLGVIWTTLISREEDGTISGLTELVYNPQNGYRAMQNLTGVKQEYRGRGLGKWLKAEMLLRFRERYSDIKFIATGNADANAPMLSINRRMGFKCFKSNSIITFDMEDFLNRI